jgi:hypothetical protein
MGLEPLVRGAYFEKSTGRIVVAGTWAVESDPEDQERRYVFLTDDGRSFQAGAVGQSGGFRPHIERVGRELSRIFDTTELGFRLV